MNLNFGEIGYFMVLDLREKKVYSIFVSDKIDYIR